MTKIRRIKKEEWILYKKIRLESLRDSPAAFSTTFEEALKRTEESWKKQGEDASLGRERCTFLIFHNEEVRGLASIYEKEEKTIGELLQVWVSPELRGTGTATDLVLAILGWAKDNDYQTIIATVFNNNETALKFYLKHGFKMTKKNEKESILETCLI